MSDGSDFNAKSGEPRKTLFEVEARFFDKQSGKAERCFRNPKTALLHTLKSRMEGNPLPVVANF